MDDFDDRMFGAAHLDVCPVRRYHIDDSEDEIRRFDKARKKVRNEMERLFVNAAQNAGEEEAYQFSVRIEFLDDRRVIEYVYDIIADQMINAEVAVAQTVDIFLAETEFVHDDAPAARAEEFRTVYEMVIRVLLGISF